MKHSKFYNTVIFTLILTIIACFFAFVIVSMMLSIPKRQIDYYLDDQNYEEVSAQLVKMIDNYYYFETDDGRSLMVWDYSIPKVVERGFGQNISIGDWVLVVSAEGYFWDGYSQPIVELTFNGIRYLDFEEGKSDLINYLKDARKKYIHVISIIISIAATATIILIIYPLLLRETD